jgi:PleD family two-component response regulator
MRLKEYQPEPDRKGKYLPTVSIGVAAYDETTDRVDLLLNFAGDALHQAKRAGRDRVVAASPAAPSSQSDLVESDLVTTSSIETG